MVKHEIKVEISDSTILNKIINDSYFADGQMGKLIGKRDYLTIEESDDVNYTIFKGLNNATVKITNDVIEGSMRFIVDETHNEVRLYPVSIYCIVENEKYSFY